MARISTYPNDNRISLEDKWIGTDSVGITTKNFTVESLFVYFQENLSVDVGDLAVIESLQGRLDEIETEFTLTSGDITGLSISSVIKSYVDTQISGINQVTPEQSTKIETSYGWGDHSTQNYLTSFTETDPTVPSHVKSIASSSLTEWDSAYDGIISSVAITINNNDPTDKTITLTRPNHPQGNLTYDFTDYASVGSGGGTDTNDYVTSGSFSEVANVGTLELVVQNQSPNVLITGFDNVYLKASSITVNNASPGISSLSYNAISGAFTYTPPNLSNFLTSVAFSDLTSTPTTIAGYGITDAFDGNFNSLTGKPNTISGYGIIDAFDGAFSSLTGTPTTIAGYGITDAFDGSYTSLTNVPTTFTPSSHNHDASQISSGTLSMNRMPTATITPTGTNLATGQQIHSYITSFNYTTNTGTVDTSGTINIGEYARFVDGDTIEARTVGEVRTDLSLNNVENVQLSTWAGSTNITTLGTIGTGTWQGTRIDSQYLDTDVAYTSANESWGTFTLTAGDFILNSDEILKDNIQDLEPRQIDVDFKTYNYKSNTSQKRFGVIAQELEKNHPEFVRTNENGIKSVSYIDLLVSKVAELEARIKELESGSRDR